ncbi:MAG: hypothetical protein JSS49_10495 [Planctomycetes bacterium]|nr:hypothetical protein [Planctomycetota bacterium]
MTDSTSLQAWIDGYLAGTLTESESSQFQRFLIQDPSAAEALALACELELLLEEHFHEELAARSQAAALISASGDRSNADCRPGWFSGRRRSFAVVAAVLVVSLMMLLFWNEPSVAPASAGFTELNRIIAVSSQPQDRTYQITVEDVGSKSLFPSSPPRRKRPPPPGSGPPPVKGPPHGSGPPPGKGPQHGPGRGRPPMPSLKEAVLHVRDGRQFVLIRLTPEGHPFVTGCNGKVSWLVRPDGPVEVSTDLNRFSRGVPGTHHSVPRINIQEGLEGLQADYGIRVESALNQEGAGSGSLKLLTATRREATHQGPARVEITYEDRSGFIQQMRFIDMPHFRQGSVTMLLKFVEARNLDTNFFDHESHHEPGRRIETVD